MAITLNGTTKIRASELNDQTISVLQPKNWIINGGFDVWQRGTSQTSAGYGSDDRWLNYNYISTKTHSRQSFVVGQTDVPNNPTYFSRTVVSSVSNADSLCRKQQHIEDVTKLSGRTISVSFWAKADSNKNISIEFLQVFGTGGSTPVTGIGVQKFALTTSWQRFTKTVTLPSVSGKTIGADNATYIYIWFDAGSNFNTRTDSLGNQSGTFDLANVSLVEGSVPVEWQTEAYADVLRQCQRYYQRWENVLGDGSVFPYYHLSSNTINVNMSFTPIVQFRAIPSSVEYNNLKLWLTTQGLYTLNSISLYSPYCDKNRIWLQVAGTSLLSNSMYLIVGNVAGTMAYLALNAEL